VRAVVVAHTVETSTVLLDLCCAHQNGVATAGGLGKRVLGGGSDFVCDQTIQGAVCYRCLNSPNCCQRLDFGPERETPGQRLLSEATCPTVLKPTRLEEAVVSHRAWTISTCSVGVEPVDRGPM
jgi:hypothetical protein